MKVKQGGCFGAERHTNHKRTPYPKLHSDDEVEGSQVAVAHLRAIDAVRIAEGRAWYTGSLVPMYLVPELMEDCK